MSDYKFYELLYEWMIDTRLVNEYALCRLQSCLFDLNYVLRLQPKGHFRMNFQRLLWLFLLPQSTLPLLPKPFYQQDFWKEVGSFVFIFEFLR